MELDRTRVAIRERNIFELGDLAVRVIRDLSPRLLGMWLLGVLPFAVLNTALIGWTADNTTEGMVYYYFFMAMLVFIQAPLATSPMTVYLGDAMFLQPPGYGAVVARIWKLTGRLLFCQGIVRCVLPAIGLAVLIYVDMPEFANALLPMLVIYLVILRAIRPFVNEVVLLEQNPISTRDQRVMTVARRMSRLHGQHTGDLMAAYMAVGPFSILLTISILFTLWRGLSLTSNTWHWNWYMTHLAVPAAMWATAGYFAVVRYLAYLDLRIRREGWAVELQLRAEGARLEEQVVV